MDFDEILTYHGEQFCRKQSLEYFLVVLVRLLPETMLA